MSTIQVHVTSRGFVILDITYEDGERRQHPLYPGEAEAIAAQLRNAANLATAAAQSQKIGAKYDA